jgi:glycosyltransferase involved in cell wall biosynthesis
MIRHGGRDNMDAVARIREPSTQFRDAPRLWLDCHHPCAQGAERLGALAMVGTEVENELARSDKFSVVPDELVLALVSVPTLHAKLALSTKPGLRYQQPGASGGNAHGIEASAGASTIAAVPEPVDVTVVITTYNRPDGCQRAIESVLAQTRPPRRLIVTDDGSTDDTPQRLAQLAASQPLVQVQRFEPGRGGPGPGRNRGIALAETGWVAFLDDDDVWLPGKLEAQAAWFEVPGIDLVCTNAVRTSGPIYFPQRHEPLRPTRADVVRDNPYIVSAVAVRTAAIRAIGGFDERVWMGGIADYDAWLRLADAGHGGVALPEPLVRYTDHASDRYSASRLAMQRRLIRHGWTRWLRRPADCRDFMAALRRTHDYRLILGEERRSRS